jgi:hypothetical protein
LIESTVKVLALLFIFLRCRALYSKKRRTRPQQVLLVILLLLIVSGLASCGGGTSTSGVSGAGSAITIRLAVQGTSGDTTVALDSVAITIP